LNKKMGSGDTQKKKKLDERKVEKEQRGLGDRKEEDSR